MTKEYVPMDEQDSTTSYNEALKSQSGSPTEETKFILQLMHRMGLEVYYTRTPVGFIGGQSYRVSQKIFEDAKDSYFNNVSFRKLLKFLEQLPKESIYIVRDFIRHDASTHEAGTVKIHYQLILRYATIDKKTQEKFKSIYS